MKHLITLKSKKQEKEDDFRPELTDDLSIPVFRGISPAEKEAGERSQSVASVSFFHYNQIIQSLSYFSFGYHALALKLATPEEIKTIEDYSFRINDALKAFWLTCGVTLVDFKLEFGRLSDGTIVLADEISPDTSRLWDSKTHEKLDKDRFRRDMGGVEEAYAEIMKRLEEHLK